MASSTMPTEVEDVLVPVDESLVVIARGMDAALAMIRRTRQIFLEACTSQGPHVVTETAFLMLNNLEVGNSVAMDDVSLAQIGALHAFASS